LVELVETGSASSSRGGASGSLPTLGATPGWAARVSDEYDVRRHDVSTCRVNSRTARAGTARDKTSSETGSTRDTITLSAGLLVGGVCVAQIPTGGATWTTTFGNSGANTSGTVTVNTSASQTVVIPAGGTLCLIVSLAHGTGGATSLLYDGTGGVADSQLIPPVTVAPESLLGFLGIAFVIPVITGRRRLLSFLKART